MDVTTGSESIRVDSFWRVGGLAAFFLLALAAPAYAGSASTHQTAWWVWPLALFVLTFALGVVAVLAGLGGGVVFVPIVSGFFPFHLDFVRAAGLLVALSGALSAGPSLLEKRLADFRLALPLALVASVASVVGAVVGLAVPTRFVQTGLGVVVMGMAVLMLAARGSDFPKVAGADHLARALQIAGAYYEPALGRDVAWTVHRTGPGLMLFVLVGFMAGMFGLGAGWANVPALNLFMGVPLKVAVGTSVFILSIVDTPAAWVYLNKGAMLPMVAVPSVLGMVLGVQVGVRVLAAARPLTVRWVLVALLFLMGVRSLLKGLGVWP